MMMAMCCGAWLLVEISVTDMKEVIAGMLESVAGDTNRPMPQKQLHQGAILSGIRPSIAMQQWVQKTGFICNAHQIHHRLHLQFFHDLLPMVLHGAQCNAHVLGDLHVDSPLHDPACHTRSAE